ncbi:hypothetical protein K402DRAFT_354052, partial [Aulographum hederae CBS 113979]
QCPSPAVNKAFLCLPGLAESSSTSHQAFLPSSPNPHRAQVSWVLRRRDEGAISSAEADAPEKVLTAEQLEDLAIAERRRKREEIRLKHAATKAASPPSQPDTTNGTAGEVLAVNASSQGKIGTFYLSYSFLSSFPAGGSTAFA